jgi:regulatory protein
MSKSSDLQKLHEQELYEKAARYCAYQPRCTKEVVSKIKELGAPDEVALKIANKLYQEKYFNNNLFAKAYASGKIRNNHWGKVRVVLELKHKGISPEIIQNAIDEINNDEYLEILTTLAKKKIKEIKNSEKRIKFQKTLYFLANKGFEKNLAIEVLNDLLN